MSLGSLDSVVSHGREGGEEMWVVVLVGVGVCLRGGFGPMTQKQHACFFCSTRRSDERSRTTLQNRHPSSKRSAI